MRLEWDAQRIDPLRPLTVRVETAGSEKFSFAWLDSQGNATAAAKVAGPTHLAVRKPPIASVPGGIELPQESQSAQGHGGGLGQLSPRDATCRHGPTDATAGRQGSGPISRVPHRSAAHRPGQRQPTLRVLSRRRAPPPGLDRQPDHRQPNGAPPERRGALVDRSARQTLCRFAGFHLPVRPPARQGAGIPGYLRLRGDRTGGRTYRYDRE